MKTIRKYWPFVLAAVVAAAIPVSALFTEPSAETTAPDEKFEKGFLRRPDNLGCTWALQQAGGPSWLSSRKQGAPITVKTEVRKLNGGMVLIGLVLKGRAGETYRPTIRKDGDTLSAPWLRIVDKQGKVLDEGQFAYG